MAHTFDGLTSSMQAGVRRGGAIISLWAYRNGPGENNQGTLLTYGSTGIQILFFDNASGTYRFLSDWSTTDGLWSVPAPSASAWHHILVGYDHALTSNVPWIYIDGVAQTVTTVTTPAGTVQAGTAAGYIGNNASGSRTWDGAIAEYAHWTVTAVQAQTDAMAAILSKGYSPLCCPNLTSLLTYLPLIRDVIDVAGGGFAVSATGTTVSDHPRVIYRASRNGLPGAASLVVLTKVVTETLGLTETRVKKAAVRRVASETLGLIETRVKASLVRRVASETLGLLETRVRVAGKRLVQNDVVGLVESSRYVRGLRQVVSETLGLLELRARVTGSRKVVSEVLGLVETRGVRRGLRKIVTETLGLIETRAKLAAVRRVVSEILGLVETRIRVGARRAVVAEVLGISETRVRVNRLRRVVLEALGLVETPRRVSGIRKVVSEALRLTESVRRVAGVVRVVNETLRVLESTTARILRVPRELVIQTRSLTYSTRERAEILNQIASRSRGYLTRRRSNPLINHRDASATTDTTKRETPGGVEPDA